LAAADDDDGVVSLVNWAGCLVMGSDRRVLCNRFNDGDVNGVLPVLLNGRDLVDDDDVLDDWLPSGLTNAKWSCGEPLMWMCVSACRGVVARSPPFNGVSMYSLRTRSPSGRGCDSVITSAAASTELVAAAATCNDRLPLTFAVV
jgi:hypothetical protein